MSRYLSEAEAWREIGRRVEKRGLVGAGLCYELLVASVWAGRGERQIIDDEMEAQMRARLRRHLGRRYLIDRPRKPGPRILAAYLLAYEAEEEAR